MTEIKVGDRVRVISERALPKVGYEFNVQAIIPDESSPELGGGYVLGIGATGGVWLAFLELVPEFDPTDKDTQNIKRAFKRFALNGMVTEDEALALFNKWYTQELEEAREEGRQQVRDAQESAESDPHWLVFKGDYELYDTWREGEARLEELIDRGVYGTLMAVDRDPDVYKVSPPVIRMGAPGSIA